MRALEVINRPFHVPISVCLYQRVLNDCTLAEFVHCHECEELVAVSKKIGESWLEPLLSWTFKKDVPIRLVAAID